MDAVAPSCVAQRTVAVVENVAIARDTYRLRLGDPEMARAILPGQFLMIRPGSGSDPLLGRPFAALRRGPRLCSAIPEGAGRRLPGDRPGHRGRPRGPEAEGDSPRPSGARLATASAPLPRARPFLSLAGSARLRSFAAPDAGGLARRDYGPAAGLPSSRPATCRHASLWCAQRFTGGGSCRL